MNKMKFFAASAAIIIACAACSNTEKTKAAGYIPEAPDYADSTFWVIDKNAEQGAGADVFYLVSTWEADWQTEDGQTCHYANVHDSTRRQRMDIEISRIAEYMAEGNNFYSPYYRHITIDVWQTLNEDSVNQAFEVAFDDVKTAFDYFLQHYNNGRPIVLAGFSQGGKAVVELLKTMDDSVRNRLVAAYVLGYKVTPQDTLVCPQIKAARSADDTGVTICYNSVSDTAFVKPIIAAPCVMGINPVNWKCDQSPATLHDSITVSLDTLKHVLVLKGYSGSEYRPIRGFLNVGDFHSCEPWLYSDCLKSNIAERTAAWRAKN